MSFSEEYYALKAKRKKKEKKAQEKAAKTQKAKPNKNTAPVMLDGNAPTIAAPIAPVKNAYETVDAEAPSVTSKAYQYYMAEKAMDKTGRYAYSSPITNSPYSFPAEQDERLNKHTLTPDEIKKLNPAGVARANDIVKKGKNGSPYYFPEAIAPIHPDVFAETMADGVVNILEGGLSVVEGVADLGMYGVYGVSSLVGADEFAADVKNAAMFNAVETASDYVQDQLFPESLLGEDLEGIAQGLGQVGLMYLTGGISSAAGAGSAATSGITTGLMAASSFGSGMSEAYNAGASDWDAFAYGAMKSAIDTTSELVFGGLGKGANVLGLSRGLSSLDDTVAKALSSKVSNKLAKTLIQYGVKATAEGFEEVLAGLGTAAAKKMTYMSEEDLSKLIEDERLLDQFLSSLVVSAIAQGKGAVSSYQRGQDLITGYTQNEQAVIDKVYEDLVAEAEKNGTLTRKDKNKIYDDVVRRMEKGYIETDDIEKVLGGETYKTHTETVEKEAAMWKEYNELYQMKTGDKSDAQIDRQAELKKQLEDIGQNFDRNQLRNEVMSLVKGTKLEESYNERSRRGQAFQADLSKYDEKQRATIQKAIDSGLLNNTNRTHEFVDMVAKIAADKGVSFDFTNNKKLKESGFAIAGKTVNGYVTKDGVTLNTDSAKALNRVVGHEITHVLEGTELYDALQTAVTDYAKSKGDYDGRLAKLTELYKGIKDADVNAELTADLVGDYLFTDADFVRHLSATNRNLFQRIFNEIKYLYRVATAGSKEARALEKVKKTFEDAYRATKNAAMGGGVKYSTSYEDAIDQLSSGKLDRTKNTHLLVSEHTPQIFIDKAGAKDLKLITGWDTAYLAMNKAGDLLGHYHGLGADVMKAIPKALEDPLYIVKQKDGRINAITEVTIKGNRPAIVSVELDAFSTPTMDGEQGADNYNLIVTFFDAKYNYLQNRVFSGEVKYNKNNEDPAHFISRLKSLKKAVPTNDRTGSSNGDIISQDGDIVKHSQSDFDGKQFSTEEVAENMTQELAPTMSLTPEGERFEPVSNSDVFGNDIRLEAAPVRETVADNATVAPVGETVSKMETVADAELAPMAEESAVIGDAAPVVKPAGNMAAAAPIAETHGKANPPERSIAPVAAERTARVLTEEPKVKKKKSGAWGVIKDNLIDRGTVFETMSLKTGNRELQAKFKAMGRAESSAQWFMEHGNAETKSLKSIKDTVEKSGKTQDFYDYLHHMHNVDRMSLVERKMDTVDKPVFGDGVTSEMSKNEAAKLEKENPEFKRWAEDVYSYMNSLRKMLVDNGVISQETADLWAEMYPHFVPIRRAGYDDVSISVPLDSKRTGVNAPVKKATGGNQDILPLFDTIAMRTEQTFKATARNRFGVELKNMLNTDLETGDVSVDDAIDSIDSQDGLLQNGKNGANPTFTVFEDGKKVTFEITDEMYNTLKPKSEGYAKFNNSILGKTLNKANNVRRGLLTEYNLGFAMTNPIKDMQDVLMNSQHPAKTYANIPKAIAELISKKGRYYQEYMTHGGEQNTYFDGKEKNFVKEKGVVRKVVGFPLDKISDVNNFIERIPRMAEYIASRKQGRSIDVAMLDAARVTTDFSAGGDFVKAMNRNGFTFLNASVQGAVQQARNIREARYQGAKGWAKLAAKTMAAGLPAMLLNYLLWGDDDDYEELSDYVKQNYYIVGKYGDGKFVRIPKGRTVAVIQDALKQMENLITGDDDVDLEAFAELVVSNLAPSNPLENNLIAPVMQAMNNRTWYGDDLVPTRLQDLPAGEQYDETTDSFSKWLGEKTGISPYKINYVLDQYSGVIGDIALPGMTPEAERGDSSFLGSLIAPISDKFTTDSVLKNQNVTDFYTMKEELQINANGSGATDDDILMSKYMNSVNAELSKLYAAKREIQNDSDMTDAEKYEAVRDLQKQIVALTKNALSSYDDITYDDDYREGGRYADVGGKLYKLNEKSGVWETLSEAQATKYKVTKAAGDALYADDGENYYRWHKESWDKLTEDQVAKYLAIRDADGRYATNGTEYYRLDEDGDPEYLDSWTKLTDDQVTKYLATRDADGVYATNGKQHYRLDEGGDPDNISDWTKLSDREVQRMNEVTKELGITPEEYWSKTEKTMFPMYEGEYEYAYDNPENYAVAKAVGGYEAYKGYSGALSDIKSDKDENGKSISGSRKEKVLAYINSLDADYYTKIILWKSEYPSDDTYNHEIVAYLNDRDDISYDEMVMILRKLGFDVTDDGEISW